jgi:hypothetical protein
MVGLVVVYSGDDLFKSNHLLFFQDGCIDYGEFVAMMTKGNMGIGRRTMRNSLNISMRDAPGAF